MKTLVPFLLVIGVSCSSATRESHTRYASPAAGRLDTPYVWTRLLDSAAWKKSYNFQLLSIRDTLWTFHPDGTWYSTDGSHWTLSPLPNAIANHAFLDYVYFNDAVYGLGHFEGNIEHYTFQPTIYRTTDRKTWTTLARESNLPKRFFYHPFAFDGKLWIIGGEDSQIRYSDIWNSADGIHWTRQRDNLPFGKRSGSQVVTLHGQLYLLDNDVWRSRDALHWEKVTDAIVPGEEIFGYSAQVFDNKIFLLGCNRNGQFSSQVLYSADGRQWHTLNAPWLPRGGIAATVHRNRIYMTGGKYGGTPNHPEFRYDNDVWMLAKP